MSAFERDAYDESTKKEVKRTSFKCEVQGTLPYATDVKLVVSKSVSPSLKSDATKDFSVSPEFRVSDLKIVSPTEACLYSTTPVQNLPEFFVTEPASKTREIMPDGRWEWKNGENREIFTCPKIEGKKAFVVSTRLNPRTEYSFRFKKGSADVYGNSLSAEAEL